MSAPNDRTFPKITEAGLDELRERIGVMITNTAEPWCHEATRDNIRHYAHGIGDDNPLWCDPDYAVKSVLGGLVALPSFLFTTSRIISGYVGGLKQTKYRKLMAEKPEFAVKHAILGMMPKGPLGRQMARKLRVYAGAEHEHEAQKPEVLELVK